jgi:hypothetical protein
MLTDNNQNEGLLAGESKEQLASAAPADRASVTSAPKVIVQESVITETSKRKKDNKKDTSR